MRPNARFIPLALMLTAIALCVLAGPAADAGPLRRARRAALAAAGGGCGDSAQASALVANGYYAEAGPRPGFFGGPFGRKAGTVVVQQAVPTPAYQESGGCYAPAQAQQYAPAYVPAGAYYGADDGGGGCYGGAGPGQPVRYYSTMPAPPPEVIISTPREPEPGPAPR